MEPCRESGDRPANEKCEIEITPEMIDGVSNIIGINIIYLSEASEDELKRIAEEVICLVLNHRKSTALS